MTALPDDWREIALKDLCHLVTDGSHFSPDTVPVGLPYVTVRDIKSRIIDFAGSVRIAEEDFEALRANGCQPIRGDVLFSKDGTVGRVARVRNDTDFVVLSSLAILRPKQDLVTSEYLEHVLTSPHIQRQILDSRTGTALRRVTLRNLKPVTVPVPPIPEQRRIVEILEDHLSRLDVAATGLTRSCGATAAMVRSALSQGLRGQLVEDDLAEGTAEDVLGFRPAFDVRDEDRVWGLPNGWLWARVGEVFEVNVGSTPSRGDDSLWAGDLPWVSSGEVNFSRIGRTREHITRDAAGNPAKRIHPPGTVMLAMIGEGRTRGQAGILNIEAAHNQNCASIRVCETKVLPEFVYSYLEERYLETRRAGSGGQQQALNKAAIQRFPIPIPPLGTQRRLVAAWEDIRASAARLNGEVVRATRRAEVLRRALLAAAFRGELTTRTRSAA